MFKGPPFSVKVSYSNKYFINLDRGANFMTYINLTVDLPQDLVQSQDVLRDFLCTEYTEDDPIDHSLSTGTNLRHV